MTTSILKPWSAQLLKENLIGLLGSEQEMNNFLESKEFELYGAPQGTREQNYKYIVSLALFYKEEKAKRKPKHLRIVK